MPAQIINVGLLWVPWKKLVHTIESYYSVLPISHSHFLQINDERYP